MVNHCPVKHCSHVLGSLSDWVHFLRLEYSEALPCYTRLKNETRWSACYYAYLAAGECMPACVCVCVCVCVHVYVTLMIWSCSFVWDNWRPETVQTAVPTDN